RTLPERAIPRAFVELERLPLTATGDLDRAQLQPAGRLSRDHNEAPRSANEIIMAKLWQEALGLERVSVHDNFFELGGYSLLCFQVLRRLERDPGQRLSPRLLLLDSLQQVAAHLDSPSASPQ